MSWSWLSNEPVECFQSPEVELKPIIGTEITQRPLDSISRNNSVEFNATELDCNQMYFVTLRATLSSIRQFQRGNDIFFGGIIIYTNLPLICREQIFSKHITFCYIYTLGLMRSSPAALPRVCVGPSTSPQHQGRVNISWDPLPCHLQNGADVTSYIINYTILSTGVTMRITSSRSDVQCSEEIGGLYSCVIAESPSLIFSNQEYSFQVSAVNNYGDGSFSNPVNVSLPVSSRS